MTETDPSPPQKRSKHLTASDLASFHASHDQTGIIYVSRIPPYMKPDKLRHLLSQHGDIGRIYLAPENTKVRHKRIVQGGNKKQRYTEGWVEFKDKHVAKQIASSLNTQPIGGKGFYAEDLWTLKYLPRFKWQNLTERIALEKASRDQRMRAEMAQAKRENAAYVENAEKASRMEHAQERLKGKGVEVEDGKIRQMFAQRKMITREVRDQVEVEKSVGKRRLLDSLL